jgi:ABC-type nitrate/sulfonate/bicarbonate transport system substrate-binding protein
VVPSEVEEEVLSSAMKEHGIDIVTDAKPGSVFCQVAKGRELFIIGGWRTRSSRKALVGGTGLVSLRDLTGKRIGTRDIGAEGDTYFAFQLRKIGMDSDRDVHWVRGIHSVSEAPDALKTGKVDAVVARSEALDNLQQQGFPILCNYPRGIPFRLIAATGQVLREYPDIVRAFLRGAIRGYWFYRTQPENFDTVKGAEIRLRELAWDPEEQNIERHMRYCTPEHFERSPFPIDGGVSQEGLEAYLEDVKYAGLVPQGF